MSINKKYSEYLIKTLPIINYTFNKKELSLNISSKKIIPIFFFFKYHTNCQYKVISDICGVDYLNKFNRFEVVYNLLSIRFNARIRVKVIINE